MRFMNIIFAGLAALAILVTGTIKAEASDTEGYGKQITLGGRVSHTNFPTGSPF